MRKPIQFVPTPATAKLVQSMADRLRTSKAGIVELAVESMLVKFEAGQLVIDPRDGKLKNPSEMQTENAA